MIFERQCQATGFILLTEKNSLNKSPNVFVLEVG